MRYRKRKTRKQMTLYYLLTHWMPMKRTERRKRTMQRKICRTDMVRSDPRKRTRKALWKYWTLEN
jgi:hypothetical protein